MLGRLPVGVVKELRVNRSGLIHCRYRAINRIRQAILHLPIGLNNREVAVNRSPGQNRIRTAIASCFVSDVRQVVQNERLRQIQSGPAIGLLDQVTREIVREIG